MSSPREPKGPSAIRPLIISTLAVIIAVLVFSAIGGCATDPVEVPIPVTSSAPCEIMGAHLPQLVRRADTIGTKADALRRNEAWRVACPRK